MNAEKRHRKIRDGIVKLVQVERAKGPEDLKAYDDLPADDRLTADTAADALIEIVDGLLG